MTDGTTPLTPPQQQMLMFLYRAGRSGPRNIARCLWSDRKQAYRVGPMAERLVDLGLVRAYPGTPRNARPSALDVRWTLTDAGQSLAQDLVETTGHSAAPPSSDV